MQTSKIVGGGGGGGCWRGTSSGTVMRNPDPAIEGLSLPMTSTSRRHRKYLFSHARWCTGRSWRRHQVETFSALLALCAGIHRSPVNCPHKGQWRGALMFSLICAWVNNREASDLGRHRAPYDVIEMLLKLWISVWPCAYLASQSSSFMMFEFCADSSSELDERIEPTLQWRHNDNDGVSNHQPHGCLLNRLFRPRSKKTSKLRVTGLCVGNSPGPVNSLHKGPVTRKTFPFDDVIMCKICIAVEFAASSSPL